jgi:tRNA U34 5-carboxymethylaminomethyl modifying enzyme MnmG/GidA
MDQASVDAIVASAVAEAVARFVKEKAKAVVNQASVDAIVASAVAEAVARFVKENAEAVAKENVEALTIEIRYEVFMQQRMTMRRMCMRSCRHSEFLFVPPSTGA